MSIRIIRQFDFPLGYGFGGPQATTEVTPMRKARSAHRYRNRYGLSTPWIGPAPSYTTANAAATSVPMASPRPWPGTQDCCGGAEHPDRGRTAVLPGGDPDASP